MADFAVGVDLGATNLRVALVDKDGATRQFSKAAMPWEQGAEAAVEAIVERIRGLPKFEQAQGVGVAVAATLSPSGEILEGPHNLPDEFSEYPLAQSLEQELSLKCHMGNDANLALLGEKLYGAAASQQNVLMLTLGTGVGAGLMLGGDLHTGPHASAAELGLWPVPDPTTGSFVPVESLAAPGAVMARLGQDDELFELVDRGDQAAKEASSLMFRYLGQLITQVHLMLDLELVLLGGGMAASGQRVKREVQAAFDAACPPEYRFGLPIELGQLPADEAGVIGAAGLFLQDV